MSYVLKYRSRKIKTFVTILQFTMVEKRKRRKKIQSIENNSFNN